jgi:hypothetical protein
VDVSIIHGLDADSLQYVIDLSVSFVLSFLGSKGCDFSFLFNKEKNTEVGYQNIRGNSKILCIYHFDIPETTLSLSSSHSLKKNQGKTSLWQSQRIGPAGTHQHTALQPPQDKKRKTRMDGRTPHATSLPQFQPLSPLSLQLNQFLANNGESIDGHAE